MELLFKMCAVRMMLVINQVKSDGYTGIDTDIAIDSERREIVLLLHCCDSIHSIKVNLNFSTSVSKVHRYMENRFIDIYLFWEGFVHSILTHHFLVHLNIYQPHT